MENNMSAKESIQQKINEIEISLRDNKHTGRTYKLVSKYIDEFFSKPLGTEIYMTDHDGGNIDSLIEMFKNRMKNDFPSVSYKLNYLPGGKAIVIRISKNFKEKARENLSLWKEKINEIQ